MLKDHYIYGLCDPSSNELRYVGYTKQPLKKRLMQHLGGKNLSFNTYKNNWIKSLLVKNLKPEIFVIQETSEQEWDFDEPWNIQYFLSIGCRLTNSSPGGDRGPSALGRKHTELSKQKMRLARLGKKLSEETKRKIGIAFKGKIPSNLESNHNKLKGVARTEDVRNKISKSHIGLKLGHETKRKLSNFNKKLTQNIANQICFTYANENVSMNDVAKKFNISLTCAYNVLHGIYYPHSNEEIAYKIEAKANSKINNKRKI